MDEVLIRKLIEVAQNAVGAYEALRIVGADRNLPGFTHCEQKLHEVLAEVEQQLRSKK